MPGWSSIEPPSHGIHALPAWRGNVDEASGWTGPSSVPSTMTDRSSTARRREWPAYLAATWAGIFAVLHLVWASGWYIGLDQESARRAFAQRWFLVYDLVVAAMCVVAVAVAVALVRPIGSRLQPFVRALAWSGTGLLALRGGAGVLQTLFLLASDRQVQSMFWLWDVWFCAGAFLFALSCWRFARG
jgi:hypothetical protein